MTILNSKVTILLYDYYKKILYVQGGLDKGYKERMYPLIYMISIPIETLTWI